MSATWYGLIEVLAGVPNLDGAACATGKRYELFDIEDPDDERAEAARNICGSCSARPECVSWFASLPKGNTRPAGTIAGRTYERPKLAPPRVRAELPQQNCNLPKPPPKPRLDAAVWLADRLSAGPVPAADVVAEGKAVGFSPSGLDRARRKLGAVSERLPGRRGASQWRLAAHSANQGGAQGPELTESTEEDPAA